MRRIASVAVAALAAAALSVGLAAPGGAGPTDLTATVAPLATVSETKSFPVLAPDGAAAGTRSWLLTDAGGNCCEGYVATTPQGRIVDFGGTYPAFSDDGGATWRDVRSTAPAVNGEGAVIATPTGDVVGVGWDAYSGDRLQAYKYDAVTNQWLWSEVKLHHPFFDRPWISVVPGPIAKPDGTSARYATVVRSNYLSETYDLFYVSYDGLTYTPSTDEDVVALGSPSWVGYLEPNRSAALDYLQPHTAIRLTPLARGGLVNVSPSNATAACPPTRLGPDGQWSCLVVPGHSFGGRLLTDSNGWLHELVALDTRRFRYSESTDGGRTWSSTEIGLDGTLLDPTLVDYKVNGAVGMAAVAFHVDHGTTSQDVVVRLDTSTGVPRVMERLLVGAGDRYTGRGTTYTGSRFDFASLALLPDGRIVVAFDDAGAPEPRLAVEQPGGIPQPSGSPSPTPTTPPPTTVPPTTVPPTTVPPTTAPVTTAPATTAPATTPPGTADPTTPVPTTPAPTTPVPTTPVPTTPVPTTPPAPTTPPPPADTTAPAAALVPPGTFGAPAVVRFDEPVSGVTAANVLLRHASGATVTASRGCRLAGAAAPCDGAVDEVVLGGVALVGERYEAVVNPPGAPPAADAAGNAAIASVLPFRAATAVEASAGTFGWRTVRDETAYGGSYVTERRAGARASYPFSGTSVTWSGAHGPGQGRVDVLVDGARVATVDTYAPTARARVAHAVTGLAPGAHVLTLKVRGDGNAASAGTAVALDAVRASALDSTPGWTLTWASAVASAYSGGSAAWSDLAGARTTLTFRGTGATWVTTVAPNAGRAAVYVDGTLWATYDNYAAERRYGVRRAVTGLPDGVHRVTVRVLGTRSASSSGTGVVVDRWTVR